MNYGNRNYDFGDDTEYKGFTGYSDKEANNLNYLYNLNKFKGVSGRKCGIYCNGELIHNCYVIRRVVEFDYSKINDNDVLEFVTISNNSIPPCSKDEFIARAKERYEINIEYHDKILANKSRKRYRTKTISCVNCGKRFRVSRRSKRKCCSKKCSNRFKEYMKSMHKSDYMKRLHDKINYDPKKVYMHWQDDRCTRPEGYNINLGNYKNYEIKTKKGKSESWKDYHKRLLKIKRNLK